MSNWEDITIYTVGHSTRSEEDFKQLLIAHGIKCIADVRAFPSSRRYPQFNQRELAAALQQHGIAYEHVPSLGGRRRSKRDSINTGLRNESFRAYADHMESEEFRNGIEQLRTLAKKSPTAVMCAEALWWRCHRSLISDHLKSKGAKVIHLLDAKKTEEHRFTPAARIENDELNYRGLL